MAELSLKELNLLKQKLLDSFPRFAAAMTGKEWFDTTLHTQLCEFLQNGKLEKIIVLPRSFLKTTFAASLYPLWRAITSKILKEHDLRVLIVSNTAPNAEKTIHQIRAWVETHPIIQQLFPEVIPVFGKVRWSDRHACLARNQDYPEATFESAGAGTAVIRRHYDLIEEDDTIAPSKDDLTGTEAMPSRDDVDKAIGFHKLTIPLLIDPKTGERVVVGTRWAEYDLINYIGENEQFAKFSRPAIKDGKAVYFRFDLGVLEKIKAGMGTFMFSMLYLNQPLSSEFMRFRPEWIQYYGEGCAVQKPEEGMVRVTLDPADPPTGKRSQDYSAIVVCQHSKEGIFVLHYIRERLSEQQVISKCLDAVETFKANIVWVETNRHPFLEKAFLDEIRRRGLRVSFEGIRVKGAKESRILALAPIAENRRLFLTKGMRELEQEMYSFPRGRHDDIIDSLSLQMWGYKQVDAKPTKKKKVILNFLPTQEEMIDEMIEENEGREGIFQWQQKALV